MSGSAIGGVINGGAGALMGLGNDIYQGMHGGGKGKTGTYAAKAHPDFRAFNELMPQVNEGILANQQNVQGIAGQLQGLANPQTWGNFTNQQLGQFDVLANQRQQAALGQLSRQGLTGTAASNMLDQQQYQTDAQRQQLAGQLGQQGLQFQAGVLGATEGAYGLANQMGNDALQNTLAKPGLQIGATSATNAGYRPGKYQGKGK